MIILLDLVCITANISLDKCTIYSLIFWPIKYSLWHHRVTVSMPSYMTSCMPLSIWHHLHSLWHHRLTISVPSYITSSMHYLYDIISIVYDITASMPTYMTSSTPLSIWHHLYDITESLEHYRLATLFNQLKNKMKYGLTYLRWRKLLSSQQDFYHSWLYDMKS